MIYENYYYKVTEDELMYLLKCKAEYLQNLADASPNPIDWEYAKQFDPKEAIKEYERFGNGQKVLKVTRLT